VPTSRVDGPLAGTSVNRSGYAQTPQGAVLAAINGQTALAVADDRAWPEVVNTVTAPGPGRDEFAAARAAVTVSGSVPADAAPKFVGFEVTDYSSDPLSAGVSVAQTIGTGTELFSYPVALQWISGDWRIVLPTSEENIDAVEIDNLDGYTTLERTP
jgi:Flp pilus assembly protein TadG